jgi:hypothetical protein
MWGRRSSQILIGTMSNSELELAARLQAEGMLYCKGTFYRAEAFRYQKMDYDELRHHLGNKGFLSSVAGVTSILTKQDMPDSEEMDRCVLCIMKHCRATWQLKLDKPVDRVQGP